MPGSPTPLMPNLLIKWIFRRSAHLGFFDAGMTRQPTRRWLRGTLYLLANARARSMVIGADGAAMGGVGGRQAVRSVARWVDCANQSVLHRCHFRIIYRQDEPATRKRQVSDPVLSDRRTGWGEEILAGLLQPGSRLTCMGLFLSSGCFGFAVSSLFGGVSR